MKFPTLSEEQIHRQVASWLRAVQTNEFVWCHVPNGGYRTKAEGGVFKALGVIAGWPDISILWRSRGLYIELKREGGKLTENQNNCHERIILAGGCVAVCHSLREVQDMFKVWGIKTRET